MNKTEYVVGFLFNGNNVALITKNRPEWQVGKLNGIGGHIEPDETPHRAIVREFKEETGCLIASWNHFATIEDNWCKIYFFVTYGDYLINTITDEKVEWVSSLDLWKYNCVHNLYWLVPMAIHSHNVPYEIRINNG